MQESQQSAFLDVFRKTGAFQKSLKAAGVNAKQFNAFLEKESASAEVFAINYEAARGEWAEVITDEITRRAITGIPKGVWHQGVLVGEETVYSDSLLSKMAEAVVPQYNKKLELSMDKPLEIVVKTFSKVDPNEDLF